MCLKNFFCNSDCNWILLILIVLLLLDNNGCDDCANRGGCGCG